MPTLTFYISEAEYRAFMEKLPKGIQVPAALIRLVRGVNNGKIEFDPRVAHDNESKAL